MEGIISTHYYEKCYFVSWFVQVFEVDHTFGMVLQTIHISECLLGALLGSTGGKHFHPSVRL